MIIYKCLYVKYIKVDIYIYITKIYIPYIFNIYIHSTTRHPPGPKSTRSSCPEAAA